MEKADITPRCPAVASRDAATILIDSRWRSTSGWRDLWNYREALYFLTRRGVFLRYKQAVLGIGWAILRPTLYVAVFTLVFGNFVSIATGNIPYAVFVFCGLLPWQLFNQSLSSMSGSILSNRSLVEKVYFPRLLLPISSMLASLPDFIISFVLLLLLMLVMGVVPSWRVTLLPVLVVLTLAASFCIGIWTAALSVKYRDFRHIVSFGLQLWTYLTPIVYPISAVPRAFLPLYSLNPMVAVIETFRWAILGQPSPLEILLPVSLGFIAVATVTGVAFFRHTERGFADVI